MKRHNHEATRHSSHSSAQSATTTMTLLSHVMMICMGYFHSQIPLYLCMYTDLDANIGPKLSITTIGDNFAKLRVHN